MASKMSDVVSASEIASWEWCPESWRLDAIGTKPVNEAELEHGRAFHARTGGLVVLVQKLKTAGWWLAAFGLAAAAVSFALARAVDR